MTANMSPPTPVEDDPYADARPPDGECWCGGCVGMGPCDDDLCRSDDEDDFWDEEEGLW
jgi:hypothetical protein